MVISCDLFCRVVDNVGDAGVCWRLARQLVAEHGWVVRMWIDDLTPLSGLRPGIDAALPVQTVDGVEIRRWTNAFPDQVPGDVVIEAFACELPENFIAGMAARPKAPVWLNLEYLSAEDWVAGCHGKPSPHPTLALTKYFFFPGFSAGTGGLIREKDMPAVQPRAPGRELTISLFCYDNPALPALLGAWAEGSDLVTCRVADGLPRQQVEVWLGRPFPVGARVFRGSLELDAMPFMPQTDYDRLLCACDINFVRGEDSFVRAQWAERPFVWQAYPQADGAHLAKVDAFLSRYLRALPDTSRTNTADFHRAWNGQGDIAAAWPAFRAVLPALTLHGHVWAAEISEQGNLAENLVRFCRERL
jgi:uncharacterized repeat protein (TIGR03837 family)